MLKKLMMVIASMLLLVNLTGCGSNSENKEPAKSEPKQEQKQEQKTVEEETFHFGYEEFESVQDAENTIKADLEKGGVKVEKREVESDEYGTTFTYYIQFEHDIDEDGFDNNCQEDYYIYYTIDNNTLELLEMEADTCGVMQRDGINEQMKVIAETFLKYYGTSEAQQQLQDNWNTHREMEDIDMVDGEGTTGDELALIMSFYVEPTDGVIGLYTY